MRGDDVAERLLHAVVLAFGVEQVVEQEAPERGHPAHARALRVGDVGRVDVVEQLLRFEARVGEGLDGGGEVHERHPVGGGDQVVRDAEAREVEARGQLAGDAAGLRDDARDADLAADRDVEAVAVAADFAAVRARLVLGVDGERDRLLERDRREHGVAVRVDRAVGFQRAHADALRHRVGVARVQVLLAHFFLAWRCRSSGRGSARARS